MCFLGFEADDFLVSFLWGLAVMKKHSDVRLMLDLI